MIQIIDMGALSLEQKFLPLHRFKFAQFDPNLKGFNLGLDVNQVTQNAWSVIAIAVVGLIAAFVLAAIASAILKRTGLETRLSALMNDPDQAISPIQIGKLLSSAVFWIVIIFTVVAALQALQLTAVSVPLQGFLNQIIGFLPPLAGAILLTGIAWGLATLVKLIVTRSLYAFGLDRRIQQLDGTPGSVPPAISDTVGTALYALVFLFFLPFILNTLGLQGAAQPILQLLNQGLAVLLNVIGAGIIAVIGFYIAKIVSRLVTNLLTAAGADQLGARLGLNPRAEGQSISQIVGTLVYGAILIPVVIAALQVLKIEAISTPAIAVLNQIMAALPKIFTAAAILAIAFVIGRFVSQLVSNLLAGIGFNNLFTWLGLPTPSAVASVPVEQGATIRTPSEIAGIVTLVGIMLFGAVTATDVLQLPALTAMVRTLLDLLGQVLVSLAIFAVGLYLANLAFNLITSSGSSQSRILGHAARISIIALISAMAMRQLGVAADIVNLAFGLLLGAIAVAIAIAFGLGGREIAAEQVREWLASFKQSQVSNPSAARRATPGFSSPGFPTPPAIASSESAEDDSWPPAGPIR